MPISHMRTLGPLVVKLLAQGHTTQTLLPFSLEGRERCLCSTSSVIFKNPA